MRNLKNKVLLIISAGAISARRKITSETVNEIFNEVFANRCEVVDRIKNKSHLNEYCLCFVK